MSSPYTRLVVPTRGFRTGEDRRRHFYKHGADFSCVTSAQYERQADEFLGGPLPSGAAECTRPGGGSVRYNETTREFGVLHADGFIATYLRLTGPVAHCRQYFADNCK